MIIDKSKTYRTKRGNAVRIYAMDGSSANEYPIHGAIKRDGVWDSSTWTADGQHSRLAPGDLDLIESDPHGILPRHRELLAEQLEAPAFAVPPTVWDIRNTSVDELPAVYRAALIALARLEKEKGE